MGRRALTAYGWIFAAAGAVFALTAPLVVAALNLLAPVLGARPLEAGPTTLWVGLSGSLLATLSLLAFSAARGRGGALAWRAILLSKAASTALFCLFAAAGESGLFLAAAAVDGAIFLHVALLRGGEASRRDGLLESRLEEAPSHEAWFAEGFDDEGRGVWVRCYERREEGGGGEAGCFGAFFDRRTGVVSSGWAQPRQAARRGEASPFELAGSAVEGRSLVARRGEVRWRVDWTPESEPLLFVPPLLHALGLGAGYAAPSGTAKLRAEVCLDGRPVELELSGCVGHVWGRRLPETWRWAHARFAGPDGGTIALELLSARPRLAGRALPALTSANLRMNGTLLRSTSPFRLLRNGTSPLAEGFAYELSFPGGLRARGSLSFPSGATFVAEQAGPDGRRLTCRNSAVGAARLSLEDARGRELFSGEGGACVEEARPA